MEYNSSDIKKTVLEEYKRLITEKEEDDESLLRYDKNSLNISLYDLSQFYHKKFDSYNKLLIFLNLYLYKVKIDGERYTFHFDYFDYDNQIMHLAGRHVYNGFRDFPISFKESNGVFEIVESYSDKDLYFEELSPIIKDYYYALLRYKGCFSGVNVQSINSCFKAYISFNKVSMYIDGFSIDRDIDSLDYKRQMPSDLIFSGSDDFSNYTFFEKVYVRIGECPKWCQAELYAYREKLLRDEAEKNQPKPKEKKNFIWRLFH